MDRMIDKYPNRILLEGMRFWGYTGCLDFEKKIGQEFVVDIVLFLSDLPAALTDDLTDTVHYGEVFNKVKYRVEACPFSLIEKLAQIIVSDIFTSFQVVQAVDITIRKPDAPVSGTFDAMGVSLFRERREYDV